jgi:S-DNA-T family DNA segregation ATPase FtsK/SpoIIIE
MIDFLSRKELFFELECISATARACGIHVIFSTQRPDKDVLNGRIKSNVTNVLGLKTQDDVNSRIIIGMNGLEKLSGKGNGLLSRMGDIIEIQTPKLGIETAKDLIKDTYINKTEPAVKPKAEDIVVDITDLDVFKI